MINKSQDPIYLVSKGLPLKEAKRLSRHGISKGVHRAHRVKRRPRVGYADRSSGEFYY